MPASLHKQSRRMSLIEAIANIAVGYSVAVAMQMLAFPLFGLQASFADNLLGLHCWDAQFLDLQPFPSVAGGISPVVHAWQVGKKSFEPR